MGGMFASLRKLIEQMYADFFWCFLCLSFLFATGESFTWLLLACALVLRKLLDEILDGDVLHVLLELLVDLRTQRLTSAAEAHR